MPAIEAVNPAEAAAELAACVREAGQLALSMFKSPIKAWTKAGSSPVSEADIAVDRLLRERLTVHGSSFGWLSEESADDDARLTRRYVWIVDPIDGTRAYLAGLPDWAVSAALVENGRPIAACLYAPVTEEFFIASANNGATCNGAAIAATPGRRLPTPASLARKAFWSGSPRSPHPSPSCRGCIRWRSASPASRKEPSTWRSPVSTAATGTLPRLIFWCTKRAAC